MAPKQRGGRGYQSWKSEHGHDYDVPAIIDYMVKIGILDDTSWHNDTMCRFVIEDPRNSERGVTLWVDHPLGSERETGPEGKRYVVQGPGDLMSDTENELETDDLETALTSVLHRAERYFRNSKYQPHWPGIVKEWIKSGVPKFE